MKKPAQAASKPIEAMRSAALRLPETQEGVACAGTAIEKRTIKVRNKAFLFLGPADAMVKLGDSITEASELASKEPGRYRVGAHGWVTIKIGDGTVLPIDRLILWVEESYRLMSPKQLVADLAERSRAGKKTGKPKQPKK